MSHSRKSGLSAQHRAVAMQLGLPAEVVTDTVLERVANDPLLVHHIDVCKDDPHMLKIVLGDDHEVSDTARSREVSTVELVRRASAALARWSASGFERVSDDTYEQRLAACRDCKHLATAGEKIVYKIMFTKPSTPSICGLCGCNVRHKARMSTESCPDGRWPTDSARSGRSVV